MPSQLTTPLIASRRALMGQTSKEFPRKWIGGGLGCMETGLYKEMAIIKMGHEIWEERIEEPSVYR